MQTPPPSPPDDALIRDQARAWFVALLDRPSAAKRADAAAWRHADPAHDAAWRAVEADWRAAAGAAQRLAAHEAEALAGYLDAMDRAKRRRRAGVALCVALAIGLGGGLWLERPGLLQDIAADHITARAERRAVTLPDGTTVQLDADSALAVDFTATERRVRLLRGAGYFDVTPAQIPFIVAAGGGEVRVLGTGFDVRLLDHGAVVTLEHGSVAVTSGAQVVTLTPGQQVDFGPAAPGPIAQADLDDALAWRGGRFVFYRARLGDVLAEIGRYRKGRIVIASATLADETVTGSFALSDTDAALASLQASVGFRLDVLAGRLTVVSR